MNVAACAASGVPGCCATTLSNSSSALSTSPLLKWTLASAERRRRRRPAWPRAPSGTAPPPWRPCPARNRPRRASTRRLGRPAGPWRSGCLARPVLERGHRLVVGLHVDVGAAELELQLAASGAERRRLLELGHRVGGAASAGSRPAPGSRESRRHRRRLAQRPPRTPSPPPALSPLLNAATPSWNSSAPPARPWPA